MTFANTNAAIQELANVGANQSDIIRFVQQLSVEASGTTTVLYSGDIAAGTPAWKIVESMGNDVRHVGKTMAAEVLNSAEFKAKVAQAFDYATLQDFIDAPDSDLAKLWMNKGGSGPWATASEMFVDATNGPVKILTELPAEDSVFKVNELPKLLAKLQSGSDITEISGIPRAKLLEMVVTGDLSSVVLNAATKETILSKAGIGNTSTFLSFTEEAKVAASLATTAAEEERMAKSAIVSLSKAGASKLAHFGPWLGILAGSVVALQAGDAYAQGRTDEAKHLIEDFAAELAGSTAGQAAAGALAAAGLVLAGVALATPVGMATVLIASVAGGYFGGDWGKEIAYLFQDRTEEQARDVAERMLKLVFGDDFNLNSAIPQDLTSRALTIDSTFSRNQMVAAAKEDIAWRYALRELNPFIISGDSLYAQHNTDGSLDLYDPATDQGSMTELYLQDRAAMLAWRLRYDADKKPYTSQYDTNEISGNWDFVDVKSGMTLAIDGQGISVYDHQIVFGTKTADTIDGSGDSDNLYGMAGDDKLNGGAGNDYLEGGTGIDILEGDAGNDLLQGGADADVLTGGKGNDRLEGGTGNDTYQFTSGDGWDWICLLYTSRCV